MWSPLACVLILAGAGSRGRPRITTFGHVARVVVLGALLSVIASVGTANATTMITGPNSGPIPRVVEAISTAGAPRFNAPSCGQECLLVGRNQTGPDASGFWHSYAVLWSAPPGSQAFLEAEAGTTGIPETDSKTFTVTENRINPFGLESARFSSLCSPRGARWACQENLSSFYFMYVAHALFAREVIQRRVGGHWRALRGGTSQTTTPTLGSLGPSYSGARVSLSATAKGLRKQDLKHKRYRVVMSMRISVGSHVYFNLQQTRKLTSATVTDQPLADPFPTPIGP